MGLGVLREIGVKLALNFDSAKFEKAHKAVEELSKEMKHFSLEITAAATALLGMAEITGRHSRSIAEQSEQLGMSTESLQEWQYAAKIAAGVSAEELNAAFHGISKSLFEINTQSSEAAPLLTNLGVDMEALRKASPEEAMMQLAKTFKAMPSGTVKTGLADQLGLTTILPLLNQGEEGIKKFIQEGKNLGVIMGEGAIKQGVEFDKTMTRIWEVMKSITYMIGGETIKYISDLVVQFQKFIIQNKQFIKMGIVTVLKGLGKFLQIAFVIMKAMADKLKVLINYFGGLEKVVNFLAVGFAVIAALKIGAAFVALGAAIASITWPIIAAGAALAGLILIVQDLMSDDSLIKEYIGKFADAFPNIAFAATKAFDEIAIAIKSLGSVFMWLWDNAIKPVADFLGGAAMNALTGALSWIDKKIQGARENQAYGQAIMSGKSPEEAAAASNQATNNLTSNIVVQVPPGTTPSQATKMVGDGVEQGLGNLLRNTRNPYVGGTAY